MRVSTGGCRGVRAQRRPWPVVPLALLLALPGPAVAAERMEQAAIMLERNATDDDSEVRFEITSGSDGFTALRVTAPDGRQILDFRSPDTRLGVRSFTLETPEPPHDGRMLAEFPAGTYRFAGVTAAGAALEGEAVLSHAFPATATVLNPQADRRNVPIAGVVLRWTRVAEISGYIVVLEHERSGQELRARLPAAVTSLAVPDGFLVGGRTYKLAVGTVAQGGNRAFIEVEFTTAR